jgi:hypothetical protein
VHRGIYLAQVIDTPKADEGRFPVSITLAKAAASPFSTSDDQAFASRITAAGFFGCEPNTPPPSCTLISAV